ncbi:MAG: helix-turn-helix domain-containing protein [Bacteroidota bacterium]
MLGARVKKIRLNSNMSVRSLAAKVGVSASFLYQLEQGKVSPSYSTLRTIAGALNTSVALLAGDELPEDWEVVRKDRRRRVITDTPGFDMELPGFLGPRNKKMQPMFFHLEPGCRQEGLMFNHEREELIYVLEGTLAVKFTGKEYTLQEGDFGYFMFDHPSVLSNPGDKTTRVLWIVSPPGT